MIDIMEKIKPIGMLFTEAKYDEGLVLLDALWNMLPDPKEQTQNSYHVVVYGVRFAEKANKLDKAWEWAQRGLAYSGNFNLGGESEFLVGEIAFARGDIEVAKKYFKKVKRNSGKRLFKKQNPKYLELAEEK